jgi:broad specificity phosphatase PhoE
VELLIIGTHTTLNFIRHGQSAANLEPHLINGRGNHHPLSTMGEQQSSLVGPWLLKEYGRPDAVVSSSAIRTCETGRLAVLAAGLDVPILIDDDLQELSQGDWTGMLRTEVYTPEVYTRIQTEKMDFKAPNGESMNDVTERKLRAANNMPEGNIWIFGHGIAIRSLVGAVMGWSHSEIHAARTTMFNTSVTQFDRTADGLQLVSYAMVDHLPDDMLTL